MTVDLLGYGWDSSRSADLSSYDEARPARVVRVDRSAVDAVAEEGVLRLPVTRHVAPVVGDWLALVDADGEPRIAGVLPRRTLLRRAAPSGESTGRDLVANVDVVLVVVPAVPEPRLGMAERLVALAWDSGASPLVVMTKADLAEDLAGVAADLAAAAPGVEVVTVSAAEPGGYDALLACLPSGRTCCLVGRSGAGKSTLVNALLGEARLATQSVRDVDGKGRHTTTHRELVRCPSGLVLVDTPGLRAVGLSLDEGGLDRTFADVLELADGCRFTDCRHDGEPGCAVEGAIVEGRLDGRRLDSWNKLRREAEWQAARTDARLRAERSAAIRRFSRELRATQRSRP